MDARSLDFVCRACGGELICGSPEATVVRVSTDSRQARAGDLFVAIKGDKFDGHDFVADVIAKWGFGGGRGTGARNAGARAGYRR